jgi:hypothetical protein
MERSVTIRFDTLPHRARALAQNTLSRVFGGCGMGGAACASSLTCCPGFSCVTDRMTRQSYCSNGMGALAS